MSAAAQPCRTVKECVAQAEARPDRFAQTLDRAISNLPTAQRIEGVAYVHHNPALERYVRRRCLVGALDASCGEPCVGRILQLAADPARSEVELEPLLFPLTGSGPGRKGLETLLDAGDLRLAARAAELLLRDRANVKLSSAVEARAHDLVWKQYLVERTLPMSNLGLHNALRRDEDAFKPRLAALLEDSHRKGTLNDLDLSIYGTYALNGHGDLKGHAERLLGWGREPKPSVAGPARRALRDLLRNGPIDLYDTVDAGAALSVLGAEARGTLETRADVATIVQRGAARLCSLPAAWALIGELTRDPAPPVRMGALHAIGALGPARPEAAVLLERALSDSDPGVFAVAIDKLPRPTSPSAARELLTRLKQLDARLLSTDASVQALAQAIGLRLESSAGSFHRLAAADAAQRPPIACRYDQLEASRALQWERDNAEIFGGEVQRRWQERQAKQEAAAARAAREAQREIAQRLAARGRQLLAARAELLANDRSSGPTP